MQKIHHLPINDPSVNWNFLIHFMLNAVKNNFVLLLTLVAVSSIGFRATQWVEGEQVTARVVTMWSNLVNIIEHFLSFTQSKGLKNSKLL